MNALIWNIRYRNKIGLAHAISNVSNKIWAFIDEVFELVGGDFNVIWDEEEKFGGLPVSLNEIDDFRHCINTCNLFDLGFKGSIFTWWNGRAEEDCIFKRLDRCLANGEFQQTFPGIEVQHLSKTGSDHSPIANPFILFNHKLKKLKKALSLWSKATFGDIFQKIASMEEVVMVHEAEFEANPTRMNRERLQKVQAELIKCLALEEKYWQQKAGMTWFKEGDRNTKFFHIQVRGRRKRLQLNRIQNSGGTWIEEEQEIAEETIKFYEEQFTEAATPTSFDIVEHVPNLINTEQNAELIKQPTKEEVKVAVLGLNGDSAGGQMAYENASGQLVNKTKSVVYLHHLTDMEVVSKVESITGIHRNDFPIIYLGCPIFYARRKLKFYQPLITKFFWSSTVGGTSRHWASWNTLCMPVEEGGIGFRSLHDVVKALFSNLWWNFRTKPSLWSSFVCQKYCKKLNPVIVLWKRGSHIWRKMLECRDLIEHQILWQTKMGSSLFWYENWTGLGALYFLVPQDFGIDENVHNVHDVTLDGEWDVDRLFEMLPEELAVHILEKIKPPSTMRVLDRPFWMLETRGYFSIKLAWEYTRRRDEPRKAYRMIWVKGLPFKIAFFMWKVWKAKLPLDDFLKRVGYCMPSKCWCCVQPDEESFQHLFFRSETAKTTWKYFLSRAGIDVEGLTLHQAITKCWTANVCLRLKPVMQALPSCVVWELKKK
ncbi:uncharacterized protein [Nicotiana sylvestris]|uniref:uncharacterized protein n=1 Tax=Nicotiana sylvestris TaxID=4096 RepID=UPI00388C9570